jgi:hypothetical protein
MDLSQDRHSLSWGKLFGCAWNPSGFIPSHPVDSHLRMAQFPKEWIYSIPQPFWSCVNGLRNEQNPFETFGSEPWGHKVHNKTKTAWGKTIGTELKVATANFLDNRTACTIKTTQTGLLCDCLRAQISWQMFKSFPNFSMERVSRLSTTKPAERMPVEARAYLDE